MAQLPNLQCRNHRHPLRWYTSEKADPFPRLQLDSSSDHSWGKQKASPQCFPEVMIYWAWIYPTWLGVSGHLPQGGGGSCVYFWHVRDICEEGQHQPSLAQKNIECGEDVRQVWVGHACAVARQAVTAWSWICVCFSEKRLKVLAWKEPSSFALYAEHLNSMCLFLRGPWPSHWTLLYHRMRLCQGPSSNLLFCSANSNWNKCPKNKHRVIHLPTVPGFPLPTKPVHPGTQGAQDLWEISLCCGEVGCWPSCECFCCSASEARSDLLDSLSRI